MELDVFVDGVLYFHREFTLPAHEDDFVEGSMDMEWSTKSLARGTHNVTLECYSKSAGIEASGVGTSVFLFMPTNANGLQTTAQQAEHASSSSSLPPSSSSPYSSPSSSVDRANAKVAVMQPQTGMRIAGDSVILKLASAGFDVVRSKDEVRVFMTLDASEQEYELTDETNTLSGLSVGEHVIRTFLVDRAKGFTLSSDEVVFAIVAEGEEIFNGDVVLVTDDEQSTTVWRNIQEIDNGNLIRFANDDRLHAASRKYILTELESRFAAEKLRQDGW